MEKNIVITSGRKYIDIDAYGGIFAYKVLLEELGYNVKTYTTAYLNESISDVITDLGFNFDNDVILDDNTEYVVLDVSNPDFIDTFVNQDKIVEIIDHHVGFEDYWINKDVKSQIEFIGSICTIIYEKYRDLGKENLLTSSLCKILASGILDNTLNLKSDITSNRDIEAYNRLLEIGRLDGNWSDIYFNSCYEDILNDLVTSIKNDIKVECTSNLLPEVLGQLIVLDIDVIFNNLDDVSEAFSSYVHWMFNVISLHDGCSYLLFSDDIVKENLIRLFNGNVSNNCIVLEKALLRKEIIKISKEYDKEHQ